MLVAANITMQFGAKPLFENVNVKFGEGFRYGLIGANGAGKSTFMKILCGALEASGGNVSKDKHERMAYLKQDQFAYEDMRVLDVVLMGHEEMWACMSEKDAIYANPEATEEDYMKAAELEGKFAEYDGYTAESRAGELLLGVGIPVDKHNGPMREVAPGWKLRVLLAQALFANPDILLLDEPTNHLDLHATEWLEEYIRSFHGTVVTISHDRYFLDRTVTRVIEIQDGKAEFYSGNYSFYAVEKERRYQERMKQYEKEQAKIAQLEKAAEQLRVWAFMGMDKTYRRAISMEKRIERMRTTDKPTREKKMTAQFRSSEFLGDEVLTLKGVGKSFGERTLFSGVDLKVAGGERIALIGDNGTGKSTLIKMIMGEEYPDEGRIKLGPSTKIAYLPQIIHFDVPQRNLVDTMLYSKRDITPQKARDRLAAFHFRGEDVFKSVSVLSGGEQSRLRLCMLMDDEVNFLILDEPTNHLDIASREWIEEAVEAFDGTLLFVSHDRYFINRFATRVWELEEQRITDYPMGFARYRKIKAEQSAKKAEPEKAVKEKSLTEKPQRGNKNQQAARRQLTICEREIAQQEEALAALDARLEEAASDYEKYSALYTEKEAQEQKLTELMERWEALAAEAGE